MNDRKIPEQQYKNWLDAINEMAVSLRDRVGTGELVTPIRAELQRIVDMTREHLR